ncbi:MAG: hypothetical protein ABIO91_09190, partial [Pyrinomonadaceae bacterium]
EDALHHLEISRRLSSDPESGTYLYKDARILDGLGRTEKAIAVYEKYLEWGSKYDSHSKETKEAILRLEALKSGR